MATAVVTTAAAAAVVTAATVISAAAIASVAAIAAAARHRACCSCLHAVNVKRWSWHIVNLEQLRFDREAVPAECTALAVY